MGSLEWLVRVIPQWREHSSKIRKVPSTTKIACFKPKRFVPKQRKIFPKRRKDCAEIKKMVFILIRIVPKQEGILQNQEG